MTAFLTEDFLNEDPLARYRREHDERQAELVQARRREARDQQRNASQVAMAPDEYWREVDARIEEKINAAMEVCAEEVVKLLNKEHDRVQAGLDQRDAKIQALRDEVEIKIGLSRKLARLKGEVEQARQRQPDFEAELASLREQNEKQQKLITRLRSEQSQLSYAQGQLEKQQQKSHTELKMTAIEVTSVGSATRAVLQRMQEEGFDL